MFIVYALDRYKTPVLCNAAIKVEISNIGNMKYLDTS